MENWTPEQRDELAATLKQALLNIASPLLRTQSVQVKHSPYDQHELTITIDLSREEERSDYASAYSDYDTRTAIHGMTLSLYSTIRYE